MKDQTAAGVLLRFEETPVPLRLVIPSHMGEAVALRLMAAAVQAARNNFAQRVATSQQHADEAEAAGDSMGQALLQGQAMAWKVAVQNVDQEILGGFAIFDQDEVANPLTTDSLALQAENLGWRGDRPELPLPDDDHVVSGPAVKVLLRQRDRFVALALQFNSQAQEWVNRRVAENPFYEEYMARAQSFAMAADQTEAALATAFDVVDAHQRFIDTHGTWLERVM